MQQNKVLRHSKVVRLTHWLIAASGLVLLFSGIGQLPMYKRYNIIKLPGMAWAGDYDITLVMHLIAAALFSAAIVFHLIFHFRRREFAALPQKGDTKESIHIIKAMLTGKKEPPHGKFLAEQRLAYAAIGGVSLILVVTGLIKVYKNLGAITLPPAFIEIVTWTHTLATPIFLLLVVAHVAAFALKANLPLLPSMFTGYVSEAYARRRHPLWQAPVVIVRKKIRSIDDYIFMAAGSFILISLILAQLHNPNWLWFTAFVGANLLQSTFTGFCPLAKILKAVGVRPGAAFK